jgi:hypothetical protein
LAAAANISIVDTTPERTEGCQRCIEMARATGKPRVCGNCEHVHDVAVTVTIRVPEPSGGFRLMKATKEIDCILEAAGTARAAELSGLSEARVEELVAWLREHTDSVPEGPGEMEDLDYALASLAVETATPGP